MLECSDLKTPDLGHFSPLESSTVSKNTIGSSGDSQRSQKFFPAYNMTQKIDISSQRLPSTLVGKMNDMSALIEAANLTLDDTKALDMSTRSSLGLLPADVMADQSKIEESFQFDVKDAAGVFKVPNLPPPAKARSKSVSAANTPVAKNPSGLPEKYFVGNSVCQPEKSIQLLDKYFDTFDDSTAAVEQFDWSRALNEVKDDDADVSKMSSASERAGKHAEDTFDAFNKTDATFFKGTMSARSTSIGGVNDNKTRTVDENFTDFSSQTSEHKRSVSGVFDASHQSFSVNSEEFGPVVADNKALMDAAEVEMEGQEEKSFANESILRGQNDASNALSKTNYFMLSTSRLGSLGTEQSPSHMRPNLGLPQIVSPEKNEPVKVTEPGDTFTVTGQDKAQDVAKLTKMLSTLAPDCAELMTKILVDADAATSKGGENAENVPPGRPSSMPSFLEETQKTPDIRAAKSPSRIPVKRHSRPGTRHSSPIKPVAKQTDVSRVCAKSTALEPLRNVENVDGSFPLTANRFVLTWISTGNNNSQYGEDRAVTLQNTTDKSLAVGISIRQSDQFSLRENGLREKLETTVEARATKTITVVCKPSKPGPSMLTGALVMRPHGLRNAKGNAIKSTIGMQACVGSPLVKLEAGFGHIVGHDDRKWHMTIHDLPSNVSYKRELTVYNCGTATGFAKIVAFTDRNFEARSDPKTGSMRLDPDGVVLPPGSRKSVTLWLDPDLATASPDPAFMGNLVVFSGPEFGRSQLAGNAPPFLLGSNLAIDANNQTNTVKPAFQLADPDVSQFYERVEKHVVEVEGAKTAENFHRLAVEETLSESVMMNNTLAAQPVVHMDPILEEEDGGHHSKAKKKARRPSVVAERDKIFFPVAKVGNTSTAQIKLRNRGHTAHNYTVEPLEPPFACSHTTVSVKPKHYLSLPVMYVPLSKGSHSAVLTLNSELPSEEPINVVLKGSTMK